MKKIITTAATMLILASTGAIASEQTGRELARCSGVKLAASTYMTHVIGPVAAADNLKSARTMLEEANKYLPDNQVQAISMRALLSMSSASSTDIVAQLNQCREVL